MRSMSRRAFVGGALAGLGLAAAPDLGALGGPAGRAAASSDPVLFGAWQYGLPWDFAALSRFEEAAGSSSAIVHWYQAWAPGGSPTLRTSYLRAAAERGAVPMISWSSSDWNLGADQPAYALASVAGGRFDDYVRGWAQGLAAYAGPVLLRWGWEMNLEWAPWGRGNGNRDGEFVAAWRHLHGIFQSEGATNVRWVWSPNVMLPEAGADSSFESLFPGDEYVDWLALDAYNHQPWYGWRSFAEIVDPSYRRITALSARPLMLAELGCSELVGHPGAKAAWIADALGEQIFEFPRIQAVVWFNERKEGDWRVESSGAARRAFRAAVSGPGYLGRWQEPA